jgi:hypothetical protein
MGGKRRRVGRNERKAGRGREEKAQSREEKVESKVLALTQYREPIADSLHSRFLRLSAQSTGRTGGQR